MSLSSGPKRVWLACFLLYHIWGWVLWSQIELFTLFFSIIPGCWDMHVMDMLRYMFLSGHNFQDIINCHQENNENQMHIVHRMFVCVTSCGILVFSHILILGDVTYTVNNLSQISFTCFSEKDSTSREKERAYFNVGFPKQRLAASPTKMWSQEADMEW